MKRTITGLAIACVAGAACETYVEPDTWSDPELATPFVVGERYAQLQTDTGVLRVFDPGAADLAPAEIAVEESIFDVQTTAAGELLILTEDPATLHIVDAASPATHTRVELGAGYDAIAQSEDGRFIILHFRAGSAGTEDTVLFTPNQITVIDRGGAEPVAREFALTGGAPSSFAFAPPFTLDPSHGELHYVVARSQGALSLVDLTGDDEANRQRVIPLNEPSQVGASAGDIYFTEDDPDDPYDMTMFVVVSGAREIFAIDLLPADPASGRVVQPAINQVSTGLRARRMASFGVDGREKLLVTGGEAQVSVVDVSTSASTAVSVSHAVDDALVWEQVEDGVVVPRALLWSSSSSIASFAELDRIESQGQGALRAIRLGRAPEAMTLVEGTGALRALARHSAGAGLDVVNLETRRLVSIPALTELGEFVVIGDWLFTIAPGVPRLVAVDLANAAPAQPEIVAPGVSLHNAGGTLLVEHQDPLGWLTTYDVATFGEGVVGEAYGYGIEGLFDRDNSTDGGE